MQLKVKLYLQHLKGFVTALVGAGAAKFAEVNIHMVLSYSGLQWRLLASHPAEWPERFACTDHHSASFGGAFRMSSHGRCEEIFVKTASNHDFSRKLLKFIKQFFFH